MRIKLIIIFIVSNLSLFAQEVLMELQSNPVIKDHVRLLNRLKQTLAAPDTSPIMLPFFDDFSKGAVFPSNSRWTDRYAFQNADYPVNPVDLGVVTLDAINDSGSMYPEAIPGPEDFIADHLTSRYIRLDSIFTPAPKALKPSDSVYLSFWYQPQGRGSAPKTNDSLVLQFLAAPAHDSITPTDTIPLPDLWLNAWASQGMTLDSFFLKTNRYFGQVMIPIIKPQYFRKDFRFRFFNYASLASSLQPSWQSNCCHWNIDNVYLNSGRSEEDTIRSEIRFTERPPSMLKNYQSMPYLQYCDNPTNEISDTISVKLTNRDSLSHTVSYKYQVTFDNGTLIKNYNAKDSLVFPWYTHGELTLHPPVSFIYPISSEDSAVFITKHYLKDTAPGSLFKDTITGYQKFFNYYAYDDGTPERGYGTTKAGSQLAYRFQLNKSPDTLRGVAIYFNKTLSKANEQYFYLTVWNDNNNKPGDTIYSRQEFVHVSDSLNEFVVYRLTATVRISGTFYVGIITTTDDNLNIGFDRYNNAQDNILYNSTGQWNSSAYSGSLLIRPLIGKPLPLGVPEVEKRIGKLIFVPNPSNGNSVKILTNDSGKVDRSPGVTIRILNLLGIEVWSAPWSQTIDLHNLSEGMYIVVLQNPETGALSSGKLIISR